MSSELLKIQARKNFPYLLSVLKKQNGFRNPQKWRICMIQVLKKIEMIFLGQGNSKSLKMVCKVSRLKRFIFVAWRALRPSFFGRARFRLKVAKTVFVAAGAWFFPCFHPRTWFYDRKTLLLVLGIFRRSSLFRCPQLLKNISEKTFKISNEMSVFMYEKLLCNHFWEDTFS